MDPKLIEKILNRLELDDEAEEADVEQALAGLKSPIDLTPIAAVIGLDNDADIDAIVARAKTLAQQDKQVDPDEYVPRAEFDAAAKTLAELQQHTALAKATAAVDTAIAAGKITPAQRDWALSYASTNTAGFDDYVRAAPVIVQPGTVGADKTAMDPAAALTEDEKAVCTALGIAADKFKESKQLEAENGSTH